MRRLALFALALGAFGVACGAPRASLTNPNRPPAPAAELQPFRLGEVLASGQQPSPPAERTPGAQDTGNVVLQGTPPLSEPLRTRLQAYLETRSAFVQSISDDGRKLLIATRFGNTQQLHVVKSPLGARTQITFASDPVQRAAYVPRHPQLTLFMADRGGDEQYQLFLHDAAAGTVTLVSDGKSRHGDFAWSDDGRQLAYTSNARNGKDMDLYLGDGRTPAAGKLLLERQGHWNVLDWSDDGKKLLIAEFVSINDSRLYVVDVASRAVTRITPEQPVASYRAAVFDRSGTKAYAASDAGGEFVGIELVSLDGKTPPQLLTRELRWNVEEIELSPDGSTLAFVVNEEGYGALYLLDTATRRVRRAPGIPKGMVAGLQFAQNTGVLAFTLSGSRQTGDAYTYDLRAAKSTRWTESELGGLNPEKLVEPQLVKFKSFDGLEVPAFYYKPQGPGPHPVVINIHGGPEAQARPGFSPLTQFLSSDSKIAVITPNVRGSDGYGKSYLLLDNAEKREDSVKDIGALLDWIATQPDLDSKRVAVYGGSYGGYMVLASLIHFGPRLRAGVDVVGISNFVTFLENTKDYRRDLRRAEYGDERDPKLRKLLLQISPTTHASKIRSALFVAHGANDPRVPVSETDQIVAAVKQNGVDVWYMVAKNEGHGFNRKENRDLFTELAVTFLEKHLQPAK